MISTYIDIVIAYINTNGPFIKDFFPILVFFASFLESTPFIGTFTPGSLFMLFFGFTAYNLNLNLAFMIFAATVGSLMGDCMGYMLGKYGTGFLLKHKKLLKVSHIEEGRKFFSNHGIKSIFIGRFIGPIRPIVPLIAGSVHMNVSRFVFYDILASFVWSCAYITTGFYFGNYFREIERFVSRTSILITLVIAIFATVYYVIHIRNKSHENT